MLASLALEYNGTSDLLLGDRRGDRICIFCFKESRGADVDIGACRIAASDSDLEILNAAIFKDDASLTFFSRFGRGIDIIFLVVCCLPYACERF